MQPAWDHVFRESGRNGCAYRLGVGRCTLQEHFHPSVTAGRYRPSDRDDAVEASRLPHDSLNFAEFHPVPEYLNLKINASQVGQRGVTDWPPDAVSSSVVNFTFPGRDYKSRRGFF